MKSTFLFIPLLFFSISLEAQQYCTAKGSDCNFNFIAGVRIKTINNPTACDFYYNYSDSLNVVLKRDSTYDLHVDWGGDPTIANYLFSAWIDFNHNNDFTDIGEEFPLVYENVGISTTPITIPTAALSGKTRMRIRMCQNAKPVPCGSQSRGEVEDYGVIIPAPTTVVPDANFSYSIDSMTVTFKDSSSNIPTQWTWDFGDGTTANYQSPKHTYYSAGTYLVKFSASNSAGTDTISKLVKVGEASGVPGADFIFTATGLAVQFTDQSSNVPSSWFWDFGDGASDTIQHPQHTYSQFGMFNVCLTAGNTFGSDTICKEVSVEVLGITYPFAGSNLKVYPVPAERNLVVENFSKGKIKAEFYNLLGKLQFSTQLNDEINILDISSLTAGCYILEMQQGQSVIIKRVQVGY